jgi:hypothetical protein
VTSQGSAHGRFERALRNGQVFQAELSARELGALSLVDALRLVVLYADAEPEKFSRAAARWLSRFVNETGLDLLAAQPALSALMLLPAERQRGVGVLVELGRRHGVDLRPALRTAA